MLSDIATLCVEVCPLFWADVIIHSQNFASSSPMQAEGEEAYGQAFTMIRYIHARPTFLHTLHELYAQEEMTF